MARLTGGSATNASGSSGSSSITNLIGATALGQAVMASSLPVVIASNQTSIPVAATLTAETSKVIGTVNQGTSPWVISNSGTFATQATLQTQTDTTMVGGVNVKEINAVTPLMGNGGTGTGSLRVTIASDNTAFSVNATLAAETTKVIGTTRIIGNGGATLDSAVGAGTAPTNQVVAGALYNSTEISPTTGQAFALQADAKGRLRGVIMDAAGNTRGANVDASSRLSVTLDNIAAAQTLATVTTVSTVTNLAQMNGAALLMGNGGTGTGSQRVTIASDNTPFPIKVDQTTPGTTNAVSIAQIGATTVVTGGVAGTLGVGGNVATNTAIGTNPINNGAQAVSSENSAVTTARMVQLVADLVGKLIVLPYANPENFVNGTTAAITDTTSTSTIAAQSAGVRTYITQITVTNSHATVGTFVKVLDGASIIHEGYAAAAGGGYTATFPVPLRGSTATAVNTQPVTTGANVIASVSGYKGV